MSKSESSNSIVPAESGVSGRYPIITIQDTMSVSDLIKEAAGGEGISDYDLEVIKMPSVGAKSWDILDVETGEEQTVKEFEGIIVHTRTDRVYFEGEYDPQSTAEPLCSSRGGEYGTGEPGGACVNCPLNKYGTGGRTGKGKACKEQRLVFLMRPGSVLPTVLRVPPTSLKTVKKYMLQSIAARGMHPYAVETAFGLGQDNKGNTVIKPRVSGTLSPEERAKMGAVAEGLKPMLSGVFVDEAPFEAE